MLHIHIVKIKSKLALVTCTFKAFRCFPNIVCQMNMFLLDIWFVSVGRFMYIRVILIHAEYFETFICTIKLLLGQKSG